MTGASLTTTITCTEQQARTIAEALELYTRICIGQFEEIAWLVRWEIILPVEGKMVDSNDFEMVCKSLKTMLGHPPNGSFGIAHPLVHESAKRAFEIEKQIEKALAEHRNPNPEFRGTNYDGRILRLTDDPDIDVQVGA